MNSRFLLAALVVFAGGYVGYKVIQKSWGGLVYVYVDSQDGSRQPAAVKSKYDFSNLKGGALDQASKQRLLSHAKVVVRKGEFGIELGHFVRKGKKGYKEFACSSFDGVELQFQATNESVSGHAPTMKVEGNCQFSKNLNRIDPIWIPIARIKNEKPGNVVLEYWDEGKITVMFNHMGGQWPSSWQLKSARLFKRGGEGQVRISDREVSEILKGEPIKINFETF